MIKKQPFQEPKKWIKVLEFSSLGVVLATGLIFAGYKFAQIQQERERGRSRLERIELTRCEQDEDCVLTIRLDQCCSCPEAISRKALRRDEDLVEYEFGKNYSKEIKVDCQDVACAPCALWNKAVCESSECKGIYEEEEEESGSPTESWRTHRSDQFKFEFKYPADFQLSTEFSDRVIVRKGEPIPISGACNEFTLTVIYREKGLPRPDELYHPKESYSFKVGNRLGERMDTERSLEGYSCSSSAIFIPNSTNPEYIISMVRQSDKYPNLPNLILSTFRFLE